MKIAAKSPTSWIAETIATWGFIGKAKFAPGTWGSLAALPLIVVPIWLDGYFGIAARIGLTGHAVVFIVPILLALMSVAVFFAGWWASERYVQETGREDPGEVVVDEVAGMLLTLAISSLPHALVLIHWIQGIDRENLTWFWVGAIVSLMFEFILFRIFDILKPWPIGWADKSLKGGFGIMADDMIAGLEAGVLAAFIMVQLN